MREKMKDEVKAKTSDWGDNKAWVVFFVTAVLAGMAVWCTYFLTPQKPSDCMDHCDGGIPPICKEQTDCFLPAQTNCTNLCSPK